MEMYNIELAENFFNSIIREIIPKTIVNKESMFVVEGFDSIEITEKSALIRTYPAYWGLEEIIRQVC
jgi:isocitrate dehydrogenase kinase/phosphatase